MSDQITKNLVPDEKAAVQPSKSADDDNDDDDDDVEEKRNQFEQSVINRQKNYNQLYVRRTVTMLINHTSRIAAADRAEMMRWAIGIDFN